MRVASLAPSNTEIVAFLGHLDALVAVDAFSDWPPRVTELVNLGPDLQIDVERLAGFEPDLVLASGSVPGMEIVVEAVEEAGMDPIVLAPESLEEVLEDVRTVASALDADEAGDALAASMEEEIARIAPLTAGLEPKRVYWEWWPDPLITIGGTGWTTELVETAGGVNVFRDRPEQSPSVELADVEDAQPDVIALCWQGTLQRVQSADRVRAREGWQDLSAVREDRILELPEHLYGRPGPRLVEGARQLAVHLHPALEPELGDAYAWVPEALRQGLPLDRQA